MLETGSTLLYPLFNLWVPDYTKAQPDLQITTQGTGSGTGISEAICRHRSDRRLRCLYERCRR